MGIFFKILNSTAFSFFQYQLNSRNHKNVTRVAEYSKNRRKCENCKCRSKGLEGKDKSFRNFVCFLGLWVLAHQRILAHPNFR